MQRDAFPLDVVPVRSEVLKPAAFLKLVREDPCLIESSQPLPPRLGERGFGEFLVTYTRTVYRPAA
jgi:hypothetical protein